MFRCAAFSDTLADLSWTRAKSCRSRQLQSAVGCFEHEHRRKRSAFEQSRSQHIDRAQSAKLAPMNIRRWLSEHWDKLKNVKASPHAVAVGVAVGMFYGFTPLVGLKTLLAIGTAWLLGGSIIAAVLAVTLHDVLLPFMPVLLRWEYILGYWVLSAPHVFPPAMHLPNPHSPGAWLNWATFLTIGRPVLIGSLFFSVPSSIASYFFMRFVVEREHRQRADSKLSHESTVIEQPERANHE